VPSHLGLVEVQGGNHAHEHAIKLAAVCAILRAQGTIRSTRRSRPLRSRVSVACPRLAVVLQAPDAAAADCGGDAGDRGMLLFEASLHHVASTLAVGATAGEQLQSGAGPLTFEVARPAPLCPCSTPCSLASRRRS